MVHRTGGRRAPQKVNDHVVAAGCRGGQAGVDGLVLCEVDDRVGPADDQDTDAGLAAAAPGGYDVIVDFLWGEPARYAMNHANVGARYIQVGSAAGPTSTISAAAIRNKLLTIVGQGTVGTPAEVRRSAYAQLMRHATDGKFTLDLEQTRLDDISQTWELLKAGPPRKLVVTP